MFTEDTCRAEAWSKCILGFLGIYFSLLTLAGRHLPRPGYYGPTSAQQQICQGSASGAHGGQLGDISRPGVCAGLTGPEVYD